MQCYGSVLGGSPDFDVPIYPIQHETNHKKIIYKCLKFEELKQNNGEVAALGVHKKKERNEIAASSENGNSSSINKLIWKNNASLSMTIILSESV